MSTELPPENVSCPNCGDGVIFSGNTPEWCPHCGASLQTVFISAPRWKISTLAAGCAMSVFGVLGPCALIGYGGWRFSQTRVGALVLTALVVFLVVAHVIAIVRQILRKP